MKWWIADLCNPLLSIVCLQYIKKRNWSWDFLLNPDLHLWLCSSHNMKHVWCCFHLKYSFHNFQISSRTYFCLTHPAQIWMWHQQLLLILMHIKANELRSKSISDLFTVLDDYLQQQEYDIFKQIYKQLIK